MSEPENFDRVLEEAGPFGRYQIYQYTLILGPIVSYAMGNAQYIFNAADLNYRCFVPECETSPAAWSTGAWGAWALPPGSRCRRRVPRLSPPANACSPDAFYQHTQACDQWVYETDHTIVAEFKLACQDWKRTMVGTVHNIGKCSSLFIVGILSDRFGRKTAFVCVASAGAMMAIIRSFSTSFSVYLLFEYLDAIIGAGVYSTGFILALEMIGPHRRVVAGCVMSCMFASGQVLLALIAWMWPHWRTLTRIIYTPSFIYLTYFFLLDESVRWLVIKGKTKKAMKIMQKMARINERELKEATVQRLLETIAPGASAPRDSLCRQVLHSRILLTRIFICSFCWSTITFVYYGLSINSVSLAGNMYVNYILASLAEIPGSVSAVFTLDRFGRKRSIMAALFTCALTLILLSFLPSNLLGLTLVLFLVGKAVVSLAITSINILTLELFPTSARHSLMNVCNTIARSGSIAAPLSPLLITISPLAPYLMFGALAGCAALLLLLTPETLHSQLPDTVAQAEHITPLRNPEPASATAPAPPAQDPASTNTANPDAPAPGVSRDRSDRHNR